MNWLVRFGLVPALLLAGCASQAPREPSISPGGTLWAIQGRLALSNGRDGGSGELTWRQGPEWARLDFVGALGRGSWRLDVEPGMARLQLASGESYRAGAVDELVKVEFGWDFPVSNLRYWVQGQPAPQSTFSTRRDGQGRLTLLQQSGWRVVFEGYGQAGPDDLPRKITATRDGDRVRLLIRQWRVGAGENARPAGLTPVPQ